MKCGWAGTAGSSHGSGKSRRELGIEFGIPNVGPETMPILSSTSHRRASASNFYFRFPEGETLDVNENASLQNNLSMIRGRHTFKTGYELLRTRLNSHLEARPSGTYRLGGTEFPFTPNTGHPFANFLLGTVTRADFTRALATWLPQWWSHALYFQDDWKATKNLTLNLGLRWQTESPYRSKYGQQSQFNPTATDPLTGRRGGLLHPTGALASRDANNFQPRVGMAYNFRQNWVFRGGFAVNTLDLWVNSLRENFEEYLATAVVERPSGNPDIAFKLSQGPPPINFNIQPDGSAPFLGTNYSGRAASFYDPAMRSPYVMNWNAGVQRQFGRNYLLEFTYQGSSGVGLLNRWDINAIPLNISSDPVQLENHPPRAAGLQTVSAVWERAALQQLRAQQLPFRHGEAGEEDVVGAVLHIVLHLGQVDRRGERRWHRDRGYVLQPAARQGAVQLRCHAPLDHLRDLGSAVRQWETVHEQ